MRDLIPFEIPDAGSEEDTERDGFLSYAGEWHALILGIGVGLTGSMALVGLFTAWVLGKCHLVELLYGGVKSKVTGCPFKQSGHMKDAAKEPGYAIGGILFGLFLNGVFIGYSLVGVL